jgi:hypothetical protein
VHKIRVGDFPGGEEKPSHSPREPRTDICSACAATSSTHWRNAGADRLCNSCYQKQCYVARVYEADMRYLKAKTPSVENDSKAIDLLSSYLHQNPKGYLADRKPIVKTLIPAYATQKACAKRLNLSETLVSRAANSSESITGIHYPPNGHQPRESVNEKLGEAFSRIDELVPWNSAHVRRMTDTIGHLYQEYQALHQDSNWKPLNEEYFRILLHGMNVKINCDPQNCYYHLVWSRNKDGLELGWDLYHLCCTHFRVFHCQRMAYFTFKSELLDGKFGMHMFQKAFRGHLFVIGTIAIYVFICVINYLLSIFIFVYYYYYFFFHSLDVCQLDPDTSRHKDVVIHAYGPPTSGIAFYFVFRSSHL